MPLIVDILYIGLWIVLVYLIATQIFIPSIHGRKLFPMFRKNIQELETKQTEMQEEDYERLLRERIDELNRLREERSRRRYTQIEHKEAKEEENNCTSIITGGEATDQLKPSIDENITHEEVLKQESVPHRGYASGIEKPS